MGSEITISSRIKELRKNLGLTQNQFAESLNISTVSISSYETGAKTPSLDMIINMAKTYNVSADWLIGLSEHKSLDDIPQTLGDILKLLFKLQKYTHLEIFHNCENIDVSLDPCDPCFQQMHFYEIAFISEVLNHYIKEWEKMLNLYLAGTIDEEVYALWIEKTINKANNYTSFGSKIEDSTAE